MPSGVPARALQGRRLLVVEDDYVLAEDLKRELEVMGAEVLGPVPSVEGALRLLSAELRPDVVLLDLNLGGEMAFSVADALQARGILFAFTTGYEAWTIPGAYAHIPRFDKPVEMHRLVRWLLG